MMTFFDACHVDMWDIFENDNYIPTNKEGVEIPRSMWNKENKTRWRPQVTTLRASKDLKKFPMEELLGMLKVHKMELNEDEGQQKGKSIALKA
ncbi:hypothetical protein CR513_36760, partial [Mucuna pruriens]